MATACWTVAKEVDWCDWPEDFVGECRRGEVSASTGGPVEEILVGAAGRQFCPAAMLPVTREWMWSRCPASMMGPSAT